MANFVSINLTATSAAEAIEAVTKSLGANRKFLCSRCRKRRHVSYKSIVPPSKEGAAIRAWCWWCVMEPLHTWHWIERQ